jgi:plasmid stabilization system protein ParE
LRALFRRAASADVEAALGWYENQRRGLGREFVAAVGAAVTRIEESPLAFPVVRRDIRRAVLQRFPYALYFRVIGDAVVVIACLHGKRHPRTWQSRT